MLKMIPNHEIMDENSPEASLVILEEIQRTRSMTPTARLNKLEMSAKPANLKSWRAPIIEIERGQELSPDHLKRLDDLKDQAKAAGWNERLGPYVVEVIKAQERQNE